MSWKRQNKNPIINDYPLLYKWTEQTLQVWVTLRVPEVIHITCNMNACDLPGTYVCPCYNYYMYNTHTYICKGTLTLIV